MILLSDLFKPVTYAEAKTSMYEALGVVGADTTMWKPLAVYRTIIAVAAIMFSVTSRLCAMVAAAGWYELSTGSWLTLVARYMYGVERLAPTFASAPVTFTNTGGGNYDIGVGEVVIRNPDTLEEYTNLTAFTIAPGSELTPTVVTLDLDGDPIVFRAFNAGTQATSGVSAVSELVTDLLNVTVENDTLAFVGLDEEDDVSLKLRCKEKLSARTANGPEDAYAATARAVLRADGSTIGINRIRINKDGKGRVFVTLATATGPLDGTLDDVESDLGLVNDTIQRTVAPLSVTAVVSNATTLSQAVTYELWMLNGSGLTNAQVEALVSKALTQALATAPIGGFVIDGDPGQLYVDWIGGLIKAAVPGCFHVVVTTPAADVVVLGKAPTAGLVTATGINQVAQQTL